MSEVTVDQEYLDCLIQEYLEFLEVEAEKNDRGADGWGMTDGA